MMILEKGFAWYICMVGVIGITFTGLINIIVEPGIRALSYFLGGCGMIIIFYLSAETTENRKNLFMNFAGLVIWLAIILLLYSYIIGGEFHFAFLNLLLIMTFAVVVIVYRILLKKKQSENKPGDE